MGSQERKRFKRSSRSIRARSRARRSTSPQVGLECSSPDEDEVSLAQRELRGLLASVVATSSFLRMVAYGGFLSR